MTDLRVVSLPGEINPEWVTTIQMAVILSLHGYNHEDIFHRLGSRYLEDGCLDAALIGWNLAKESK